MNEDEAISKLKERIASANYFNMTPDDYINKITDIYYDNMFKTLENFYVEFGKEAPELSTSEKLEISADLYDNFESTLYTQLNNLEDFCNLAIFRIPKKISLPNDLEINEAIGKFSVEENEKITQKIKELEMNIKQKKLYAKLLKEQIETTDCVENVVDFDTLTNIKGGLK